MSARGVAKCARTLKLTRNNFSPRSHAAVSVFVKWLFNTRALESGHFDLSRRGLFLLFALAHYPIQPSSIHLGVLYSSSPTDAARCRRRRSPVKKMKAAQKVRLLFTECTPMSMLVSHNLCKMERI
jgi:hypothetical protein